MQTLTIHGKTYRGETPMMAKAIQHFKRVLARHNGVMASGIEPESGPIAVYHQFVHFRMRDGRTRAQAIREFTRDFPQDHAAYIREYNERHGRKVEV